MLQVELLFSGVLEMWVDMFTTDYGWIPSAVNIALRQPVEYQLRVIVWNTADVELMDDAYFTGMVQVKQFSFIAEVNDFCFRELRGKMTQK